MLKDVLYSFDLITLWYRYLHHPSLFSGSVAKPTGACNIWPDFHKIMERPVALYGDLNVLTNAISLAAKTASKTVVFSCHRKRENYIRAFG